MLLEDYYNKSVANIRDYELLADSGDYHVPTFDAYQDYLAFVDNLPLTAPPGVYGFHVNANITKELNETSQLIDTLLICQGGGSSKGSDDSSAVDLRLPSSLRC